MAELHLGDDPIQPPLFSELPNPCPDCGGPTEVQRRGDYGLTGPRENDHRRYCVNPSKSHMMHFGTASTMHDRRGCGWYSEWWGDEE